MVVATKDAVTLEILRHRLWAINNEAAEVLRSLSGSPISNEGKDFNVCLISPGGEGTLMGPYVASHGVGQPLVVQHILREYQENPGIREDDMFICNDPYSGPPHQNDVTIVAPVHWEGEIVAWFGATLHQMDVGGPVEGSQTAIDATSIYGEPLPMPPIKLVEGGRLRKDIEAEYLIRSRTREANALDTRAQIGCLNAAKRRLHEVLERYGPTLLAEALEQIPEHAAALLRARLRELPDGTWTHTSYLDYDDGRRRTTYACPVTMSKQGDRLVFDYSAASPQAPAMINCTYSGLLSGVVMAVFTHLCYDIPWSPAGVLKVVEVASTPGTFVHAQWPAGACKGTTGAGWLCTQVAAGCLSKMLAASDAHRDHAMAGWCGNTACITLFGTDQRGKYFGAAILDSGVGGAGATNWKDGMDTGGFVRSLTRMINNVETTEARYPVLYLFRRQNVDSGGPGKYRGGVGARMMLAPYDVERIGRLMVDTFSYDHSESFGLAGGWPAVSNQYLVARSSDVWTLVERGTLPQSAEEIGGRLEILPNFFISSLERTDAFSLRVCGGGGYGDPLDRDPARVLADVRNGLVSQEGAASQYGVVVSPSAEAVDGSSTARLRAEIRAERQQTSTPATSTTFSWLATSTATRANEQVAVVDGELRCRCGQALGRRVDGARVGVLLRERALADAAPAMAADPSRTAFHLREEFCPGCLTSLNVEYVYHGC